MNRYDTYGFNILVRCLSPIDTELKKDQHPTYGKTWIQVLTSIMKREFLSGVLQRATSVGHVATFRDPRETRNTLQFLLQKVIFTSPVASTASSSSEWKTHSFHSLSSSPISRYHPDPISPTPGHRSMLSRQKPGSISFHSSSATENSSSKVPPLSSFGKPKWVPFPRTPV